MVRVEETLEVDYSEVEGRTYRCVDGCALCCLCQPELLPDEEARFRKDQRLAEGIAESHISPEVKGAAIKLRGAHGSCHFLRNKRCTIYQDRPHFCRAFPISVFVGWRVQLNANLSCRGMGLEGEKLGDLARSIVSEYGQERLVSEVAAAKSVFTEFVRNTRDTWTAQSFSSVRGAGHALGDDLVDELGLSRILTYAEHGRTKQNAPANDIARLVRRTEAEAGIEERALIDGTELFDLPDLSLLPIYIDEKNDWKIFKLVGKEIVGYQLDEDGQTREFTRVNPSETELVPLEPAGKKAMKEYLGLVNSRDSFLGHAAYLSDMDGYEFNFAQTYLGALATNSLDLWWRASFLARLERRESLGEREIREGIVFFDMDLLDLPTVGAFI